MNLCSCTEPGDGRPRIRGSRRDFLGRLGGGFGGIALSHLLHATGGGAARPAHHPAAARRVIQLFMNGGASQMDLFDHKPLLARRAGEPFDPGDGQRVEAPTSEPGKILAPPFPLRQHGASGRWVSDLLPHLAGCVDDLAFLMAMQSRTNVHGPASYLMNTGFLLPGFPCLGAWVSYALGNEADNLPTFVVLPDRRGLPYNQRGNFSSGFLPVSHQGTLLDAGASHPLAALKAPATAAYITPEAGRDGLEVLQRLNRRHQEAHPGDARLEARIAAYELAARMQLSAPEALSLDRESAATRRLYGLDREVTADFGRRCLLARRLVERGVRFVQVWSGAGGPTGNWDNHASIVKELPPMCAATDQPVAALLRDLKARGLLDDTLVLWNTEFGRMPFSQSGEGRDHNGGTYVGWMAGGGVRPGVAHGASDEWSWKAAHDKTTHHDLHATVLHLLGLDHTRLTWRHDGADRRLTDVHGEVIRTVLA
ncbi:MAG: DUF1501 domain-containing protein [Verrucomicrobiae bacterium]|nr:DUF1501 domain-containing protein [Verrucomicrobiae bacterium]